MVKNTAVICVNRSLIQIINQRPAWAGRPA